MESGRSKTKISVIRISAMVFLLGAVVMIGRSEWFGKSISGPDREQHSGIGDSALLAAVGDIGAKGRAPVVWAGGRPDVQDTLAVKAQTRSDSGKTQPGRTDSVSALAPVTRPADSIRTSAPPMECPAKENLAFAAGEFLTFDIAYGPVVAGTATMAVVGIEPVAGRPCFHIVTTAESSPFFSAFYKVRDRVELRMDAVTLLPWRFEKHIREGKYRADVSVVYDQINHRVIRKKDTLDVAPCINDILSSFYYIRTVPLTVGKPLDLDNYGDGKIYPLRIFVHKKERVKVPAGRFDCIVVEPVMRVEGIFNQKGKMTIWLTDDVRRIPVLMKSKILVGSIDARLRKIGSASPD